MDRWGDLPRDTLSRTKTRRGITGKPSNHEFVGTGMKGHPDAPLYQFMPFADHVDGGFGALGEAFLGRCRTDSVKALRKTLF